MMTKRIDLYSGLGFTAFSLLLLFWIIPTQTQQGQWYGLSPAFMPNAIAGAMCLAGICLILQSIFGGPKPGEEEEPLPVGKLELGMVALSVGIILAGMLTTSYFGIWIGGPLMIGALMVFMGQRDWRVILPTATIPVGVVYAVATYVLRSPLP